MLVVAAEARAKLGSWRSSPGWSVPEVCGCEAGGGDGEREGAGREIGEGEAAVIEVVRCELAAMAGRRLERRPAMTGCG